MDDVVASLWNEGEEDEQPAINAGEA
jgi:hypothetical protein